MRLASLGSADQHERGRDRPGVVTGIAAGVIALSCCVGPAVAALLGMTTAAVAIDVATDLYGNWGWAFKLAGVAFAATALLLSVRRRRTCGAKPRVWRSIGMIALSGIATYSLLYGATTWLGARAAEISPPPTISAVGSSVQQRVKSALTQVRRHYPHFRVDIEGLSSEGVTLRVGWQNPDIEPLSSEYNEELTRRIEGSREATMVLLGAVAHANPSIQRFSAYEDRIFIPIWSREQILAVDPAELRDFNAYTDFVFSAKHHAGYATLFGDQGSW